MINLKFKSLFSAKFTIKIFVDYNFWSPDFAPNLLKTFFISHPRFTKKDHRLPLQDVQLPLATVLCTRHKAFNPEVAKSFWTDFEVLSNVRCRFLLLLLFCPINHELHFVTSTVLWYTTVLLATTHYCTVIVCTSTTTDFLQFGNFMLLIWLVFYEMFCLFTYKSSSKGQMILKCLFGVFNFLQKGNKNKLTWGIIVLKSNFFVCF